MPSEQLCQELLSKCVLSQSLPLFSLKPVLPPWEAIERDHDAEHSHTVQITREKKLKFVIKFAHPDFESVVIFEN